MSGSIVDAAGNAIPHAHVRERDLVSATTGGEGDAQTVELRAGQVADVALASRGTGAIDATVLDFRTQRPIAGARCQVTPARGGELGAVLWDITGAPVSDAAGYVAIDPAPAGEVAVICVMSVVTSSLPIAIATVPAGGRAAVQLYSVAPFVDAPGSLGLSFDSLGVVPRIGAVAPGSPAAAAGFAAGDVVVAVDGTPVDGLDANGVQMLVDGATAGTPVTVAMRRGTATLAIRAARGPRVN